MYLVLARYTRDHMTLYTLEYGCHTLGLIMLHIFLYNYKDNTDIQSTCSFVAFNMGHHVNVTTVVSIKFFTSN